MMREHVEVIKSMERFVESNLDLLKSVSDSWQPSDILPDMTSEGWHEETEKLREQAREVPDELLIVLVGNAVTEEALPSYQTMINRHPGVQDDTGASDSPWALWSRGWTAEENRHGQILTSYLYLSGRIDMHAYEITTQYLIRNGFDPKSHNDPYQGLIYTSFQERATKISHGNTARLANQYGDPTLGKICALVTGDESRHEEAYKRFVGKIVEKDPSEAIIAFALMMRNTVTMPARRMSDGQAPDLYNQFAVVAQRIGVYTIDDYADILDHLLDYWKIKNLRQLSPEAQKAQDYLGGLSKRYRALAQRAQEKAASEPKVPFSWIFSRRA